MIISGFPKPFYVLEIGFQNTFYHNRSGFPAWFLADQNIQKP
jgi:hypothetical protein